MAAKKHKDRAHALLSASGAHRWLECTPSALLEEKFKADDEGTVYSLEGTFAHELGELEILQALEMISTKEYQDRKAEKLAHEFFNDEMEEEVDKYVQEVLNIIDEARKIDRYLHISIEDRFDLGAFIPEGFGSNDVAVIAGPRLIIGDLKFGKGVRVSAEDNPQLRLYALGALHKYGFLYEIEEVEMIIFQPRLNNVSRATLTPAELLTWAEEVVKPKAALAFAGEGELNPGDHCRFCKVGPRCRALAEKNLELLKYQFEEPKLLTDAQLLDAYDKSAALISWANLIQKYVLGQALEGVNWPGYKLVEGRANRKITDEEKAAEALKAAGFTEAQIQNTKLKGLTDLTKLLGKTEFEAVLGPFVVKPKGTPTLAEESDPRPAINNLDSLKNEFD
jgi:hypothetical protein